MHGKVLGNIAEQRNLGNMVTQTDGLERHTVYWPLLIRASNIEIGNLCFNFIKSRSE